MRMIRRNIIRYVALVQAMVFRDMSPVVRKRFPTDEAFEAAGFLTEPERRAMEAVVSPHGKYWLPIHWAFHLIKQARLSGNIASNRGVELLQDRIREYRTGLAKLRGMHWVPVPLAYAQVVFLATRSYLALGLLGRQYINTSRHKDVTPEIDLYIPVVSILQFIFYLGWMKVAEALLNPFGDDDDDFECNWFIDRQLQMGLSAADDAIGKEPPLGRDIFWNDVTPVPLYAHGTNDLPVYLQNMSRTEKTAIYLGNAVWSTFFRKGRKSNKVANIPDVENNLNEEALNKIPDSSDQQMFKDECQLGLVRQISRQFSSNSRSSVSHPRSPRHSESNRSVFSTPSADAPHRKLSVVNERNVNSTVVQIDDEE
uniref:Bestrophin homolog n=1 Tax=Plectus sambesii TaxID=2011161 RepID=A0A914WPQ6_9BILA